MIAVIIPCYRVKNKILEVVKNIGPEVGLIVAIDDACPEASGNWLKENCKDSRLKIFFQSQNSGVGGACLRGFAEAQKLGAKILVKLDGDGQMDPALIPGLLKQLVNGNADFVKGNRFFTTQIIKSMPVVRLFGNAGVSFLSKLSSGYWQLMDPSNGFLAFHANLLDFLEVEKIDRRYFFEADLLFRLGLIRAVVCEFPMKAKYADEKSSLNITHTLLTFPGKFICRFFKRIAYRYFIRDFNIGSCLILFGSALSAFGLAFGVHHWLQSIATGQTASSGTVMVAALPFLLGMQMLFFAFLFDVLSVPKEPIHPHL